MSGRELSDDQRALVALLLLAEPIIAQVIPQAESIGAGSIVREAMLARHGCDIVHSLLASTGAPCANEACEICRRSAAAIARASAAPVH